MMDSGFILDMIVETDLDGKEYIILRYPKWNVNNQVFDDSTTKPRKSTNKSLLFGLD